MEITVGKVSEIINEILEDTEITPEQCDLDLTQVGMDSVKFIELILSLEEEFGCVIPDSKLLLSQMDTPQKIYDTLLSLTPADFDDGGNI